MTTGADIVAKARSFKGETEHPAGSNRGPFVQACQADTFLGGTGWPWCAAFDCHIAKLCGVSLAPSNSAGAHDLADRHRSNWVPNRADWKPGMVVDYNIGSGHTGILTSVSVSSGTVTSCDGNWSDSVTEHTMPMSEIRAVWAIPGVTYARAPKPAPKPKPKRLPNFVVTTSASGHRKVLFTTHDKHKLASWLLKHTLVALAPNGITISRGKAK